MRVKTQLSPSTAPPPSRSVAGRRRPACARPRRQRAGSAARCARGPRRPKVAPRADAATAAARYGSPGGVLAASAASARGSQSLECRRRLAWPRRGSGLADRRAARPERGQFVRRELTEAGEARVARVAVERDQACTRRVPDGRRSAPGSGSAAAGRAGRARTRARSRDHRRARRAAPASAASRSARIDSSLPKPRSARKRARASRTAAGVTRRDRRLRSERRARTITEPPRPECASVPATESPFTTWTGSRLTGAERSAARAVCARSPPSLCSKTV